MDPVDTRLYEAVWDGELPEVVAALKEGATVNVSDTYGRTPIHLAALRKLPEIMEVLLDTNLVKLDTRISWGGCPVHSAATNATDDPEDCIDDPSAMKLLVDAGADVTARDETGDTPLHIAAINGHVAIVKYLLSLPQVRTLEYLMVAGGSESPLTAEEEAMKRGHTAVLRLLRDARHELENKEPWRAPTSPVLPMSRLTDPPLPAVVLVSNPTLSDELKDLVSSSSPVDGFSVSPLLQADVSEVDAQFLVIAASVLKLRVLRHVSLIHLVAPATVDGDLILFDESGTATVTPVQEAAAFLAAALIPGSLGTILLTGANSGVLGAKLAGEPRLSGVRIVQYASSNRVGGFRREKSVDASIHPP